MRVRRIFPLVVACFALVVALPAEAFDVPDAKCAGKIHCRANPPCDAELFKEGNYVCYVQSCAHLCPP